MEAKLLSFIFMYILLETAVTCLDNGLAGTPPMGWMHWERFRCNIDCKADPKNCIGERLIKETADAMVSGGFRDAGYRYVSIDDCWMLPERGPNGRLQPDPARFPNGMKALADYVHSKGLKLGIYEDMGIMTCKKYPGSKFYLQLDADTFASWGIDMLKLDCCYAGGLTDLEDGYQAMGFFLNKTGRPVLFSCSWPACSGGQTKYQLVAEHCNMWRNYADMRDSWETGQPLTLSKTTNFMFEIEKTSADNKLKIDTNELKFSDRIEKIVAKGENAGYQHFLLFPPCFQKPSFPGP